MFNVWQSIKLINSGLLPIILLLLVPQSFILIQYLVSPFVYMSKWNLLNRKTEEDFYF